MVKPNTNQYNLKKDFVLDLLYYKVQSPIQYACKLDRITEHFAYTMARNIAELVFEADKEPLIGNQLLHNINLNEKSEHIILYPVEFWSMNCNQTIHKLMEMKLPNVHLQPFIIGKHEPEKICHLVTPPTRYGNIGYDIQSTFDWEDQNIELTMRLFYIKDNKLYV